MLQQNVHFFAEFLICLLLKILFYLTFSFLYEHISIQKEQNEFKTHIFHSQDISSF